MVTTQTQVDKGMSVNVALCGSIPRAHLTKGSNHQQQHNSCSLAPALDKRTDHSRCGSENITLLAARPTIQLPSNNNENTRPTTMGERQPLAHVFEAPSWAVPASGETRLEPVCESYGRHRSIDLTAKAFFRIGRSPHCDVQLVHQTSSRRHAMLFHHSNGGCYIVDCGSAHGTFVNGTRLPSPTNGGVVVPHKVRRGALIRFGGPGAPCFVLKSFSFQLKEVIQRDEAQPDMGELVRRNTRLNALGKSAADTVREQLKMLLSDVLAVTRKRSFDSLATTVSLEDDLDGSQQPAFKRMRCESPPLSPEVPLRLVSPDYSCSRKYHRVTFAPEVIVNHPVTIPPADDSEDEASV